MGIVVVIVVVVLGFVLSMYLALFLVAFLAPTMGYEAALPLLLCAGCVGAAVSGILLRRYRKRRRANAP